MKRLIAVVAMAFLLAGLSVVPALAEEDDELAVAVEVTPDGQAHTCSVQSYGHEVPNSEGLQATYGAIGVCYGVPMDSIKATLKISTNGVGWDVVRVCYGDSVESTEVGFAGPCGTLPDLQTGVYDSVGRVCFLTYWSVPKCATSHFVFVVEPGTQQAAGAQQSGNERP